MSASWSLLDNYEGERRMFQRATQVVLLQISFICIGVALGLNLGRDAKQGEFPYIVRITVSEELMAAGSSESILMEAIVATGVLLTTTRILTTCDSVGSFVAHTINPFNLSRVAIMAGSVSSGGEGGQTKKPNSSNVHPYCHSIPRYKTVLFNYGIYTIDVPFDDSPRIKPIEIVSTKYQLKRSLRRMWEGGTPGTCVTAGWGNPEKQFEGEGKPDSLEQFSKVLQTTVMDVVDYITCQESTCTNFDDCLTPIWEWGYVCAKAPAGGPCYEDNGAPLVCSGQLFGIHTNPQRCEDEGLPRHFMRIDLAFDYVSNVKDNSAGREVDGFYVLFTIFVTCWCQLYSNS